MGSESACVGPLFQTTLVNSWLPKSRFSGSKTVCFPTDKVVFTLLLQELWEQQGGWDTSIGIWKYTANRTVLRVIIGGWRGAMLLFLVLIGVFSYSSKTCSLTQTIWYGRNYCESWCMQEDMQKRFSVCDMRSLYFAIVALENHWSVSSSGVQWSDLHFLKSFLWLYGESVTEEKMRSGEWVRERETVSGERPEGEGGRHNPK